ncbi:MAG: GAF domain-containing protein [Actinomycetota bacterium]
MNMETTGQAATDGSEKRYDELAALYRIAALNAAQEDRTQLVADILGIVGEVVAGDQVLLFSYDDEKDELRLHEGNGRERLFGGTRSGIISRALSGSAQLENEVTDEDPGDEELRQRTKARQVVAVPLNVSDRALGVLAVVDSQRGAFRQEDVRILSILGDRVAVTLENVQLVETLSRQVRELEGLQRLSSLLTDPRDLESAVDGCIHIVMEMIDCEKIAILLYDEETNSLVAHPPVIGITDEQLAQLQISMDEPSLGGTVFRTNTGLYSNDAENDQWVNQRFREILDMETLLVVPLGTGPRPMGVLKVVNAKRGFFDQADLRFAMLLGRQAGAVLESNLARSRERGLLRELREADRTKSEFVSMLAHELKGPMTTVLGFSHTLLDQGQKIPEDKRDQILSIINKETERLSRLVNDLLDVSRMEAGTLRYEPEPTSIHEIVESILTVHTSLKADHAVLDVLPEDLPKVLVDRDRIRQVVINLLTNATRYSPEGSTVTIGAEVIEEADERFVKLFVKDEGIGIAPHDSERIWNKFAMLPKPGWTKKGTGLGLYITKGIVEAGGGRIWVDSEIGRGSTFNLTMRIAEDASRS